MYRKLTSSNLHKIFQIEVCEGLVSGGPYVASKLTVNQYIIKVYHHKFTNNNQNSWVI